MTALNYALQQQLNGTPIPWSPQDDEELKKQALQLALAVGPGQIKGQSLDGIMRMMEMSKGMFSDSTPLSAAWTEPVTFNTSAAAKKDINLQGLLGMLKRSAGVFGLGPWAGQ